MTKTLRNPMIKKALDSLEARAARSEKTYIIPSHTGLLYIGVNFTLFMMGLVYANNLALLLAFSMFAALLLIMFETHGLLDGIQLDRQRMINNHVEARPGVAFAADKKERLNVDLHTNKGVLKTKSSGSIFSLKTPKRGVYVCRHLKLWTTGKSGFFYVWTYRACDKRLSVYPALQPSGITPPGALQQIEAESGEFNKHGPYTKGDSAKRIDWRAFARSDQLLIKNYEDEKPKGLRIDQNFYRGNKEEVISQMAWQVDQAFKEDIPWEVNGKNFHLALDRGPSHWRSSMEALSEA